MSYMYTLVFTGDLSTGKPLPIELLANPDVFEEVKQKMGSVSLYAFDASQLRVYCALLAGIFFFMVVLHSGHDPEKARPGSAEVLSNAVEVNAHHEKARAIHRRELRSTDNQTRAPT
ncbi:hypothetical protein CYMTET_41483 [Cymbomonas tetramitiformis]|uniref:Uncharacterized protein n=1 Tax=Cymbomonas tetramitiformis TaxID=36881 RepID=A0AAE0C618_9CHLO|nr:hypothetical protein CYMTET_41483 [Cymbomonas tetramitiformis]